MRKEAGLERGTNMPIGYEVDVERRRLVVSLSGRVSIEEMLDAIRSSVADPRFESGFDVLSDHTKLATPIAPGDVPRVIQCLRSVADKVAGARWAVVAPSAASFGMMRLIGVQAEAVPIEIRVFGEVADAEAWLASGEAGPRDDDSI